MFNISTKLEMVNKTIEDLRQQLAKAEAEAGDLNTEISSYNASIDNVKSKYSRQLNRLEKKSKSVMESRDDWTSEKESIEKAKSAHEAVVTAHSEDMVMREKIIEDIKVEIAVAADLEELVNFHSSFNTLETENGEDGVADSSSLDDEVLKYEAIVNEANENVAVADANIANLKEELSAIEVRVPILEDLKKAAASKRDFKAAGKASKDIKDALTRKEQCQSELEGGAMERKQHATAELEKASVSLEEKKKIAEERGKEMGLKKMDHLRKKIDQLKALMKKYAKDSDGDEDKMDVSIVGEFVLENQICILEAQGSDLGRKYGGWDVIDDSSVCSAPSFDSVLGDDPDIVIIDKDVLERYTSMRNEIKEYELHIEQAVSNEDYDTAAGLEEKAEIVRDKFNDSGYATERFKQALEDFINNSEKEETVEDTEDKVMDECVLEKYSSFCKEIKEIESDIEQAVSNEDYDAAAGLEEKLIEIRSHIESLGFSPDDLDEALNKRSTDDDTVDQEEEENGELHGKDGAESDENECEKEDEKVEDTVQ